MSVQSQITQMVQRHLDDIYEEAEGFNGKLRCDYALVEGKFQILADLLVSGCGAGHTNKLLRRTHVDLEERGERVAELTEEVERLKSNKNGLIDDLSARESTIRAQGLELGELRPLKDSLVVCQCSRHDVMELKAALDRMTAERSKHLRKIKRLEAKK